MKWYRNLYVSNSIGDKANRIKWKINHNAGTISVYVIAFASNSQNLLDIIPAWELMQKSYPKKQMKIIGLAKGYEDGTFRPDANCTRGQMCAFLRRIYNAIKEGKC